MSRKPITQDGHSIYRTAAIEVDLELVSSGSIVYLESGGSKCDQSRGGGRCLSMEK